jgi:hypothetical protein
MPVYTHIDPAKPLMVVVDTSVFLHKLDQSVQVAHTDPAFASIIKANLVWLMSGIWLGEDIQPLMQSMVFALDTKDSDLCYWRTHWLKDLRNTVDLPRKARSKKGTQALADLASATKEILDIPLEQMTDSQLETHNDAQKTLTVAYKAGRAFPEGRFKKIRKLVYGYLSELNARRLESSSYEADDMAAALVATNTLNGDPWSILLLTVDTDWLGLVNPSVTWCCMSGFFPVIRDTLEVCNSWVEKRLKTPLNTWREIWDIKGEKGDASDNLPPSAGKLLPVIDLLQPPLEYRYWLRAQEKIGLLFQPEPPRFNSDKAKVALSHLVASGLSPVVRYLPGEDPATRTARLADAEDINHPLTDVAQMVDMLQDLSRQTIPEGVF